MSRPNPGPAPIPTARELARMVREMRALQKAYFAGQKHVIDSAKESERRVDEACYAILSGQSNFDFGGADE